MRFRWKDYAHGNQMKVMALPAEEFLRRFLLHVVPSGFMRIRHFGLLANRRRAAQLARCRALLEPGAPLELDRCDRTGASDDAAPWAPAAPQRCPLCGGGPVRIVEILGPLRGYPAMTNLRVRLRAHLTLTTRAACPDASPHPCVLDLIGTAAERSRALSGAVLLSPRCVIAPASATAHSLLGAHFEPHQPVQFP